MIIVVALFGGAFALVNAVSGIVVAIMDHMPTVEEQAHAAMEVEDV